MVLKPLNLYHYPGGGIHVYGTTKHTSDVDYYVLINAVTGDVGEQVVDLEFVNLDMPSLQLGVTDGFYRVAPHLRMAVGTSPDYRYGIVEMIYFAPLAHRIQKIHAIPPPSDESIDGAISHLLFERNVSKDIVLAFFGSQK